MSFNIMPICQCLLSSWWKSEPWWCLRKDAEDKIGSKREQDRHGTCDVTLRCGRATIVAVEKQWVLHNLSVCVYSLRYAACNKHAPRCLVWPAPLYNICPHYFINGTVFGEKKLPNSKMCVSRFSTAFFWKISPSKQDMIKMYIGLHVKYSLF